MRLLFGGKKRWWLGAFAVVLGGLVWWQRAPILAWYCVAQLVRASDTDREAWVGRITALDEAARPRLLAFLDADDPRTCDCIEAALVDLACSWGAADRRALTLVEEIKTRFRSFSQNGKRAALRVPIALLKKHQESTPAVLLRDARDLMSVAAAEPALRCTALVLAGAIVERAPIGQAEELCRSLAVESFADSDNHTRAAALHLALRGPLRQDLVLLAKAVPLLRDPVGEVRHAALLVLGPARDVASEDDLLPLLHDPDPQVQQLCEVALRSRGLQEEQIEFARLISDDSPKARLEVVHKLRHTNNLDVSVWLRRLSRDPSPAVRAAAARASIQQHQLDLRDRLAEMAVDDPSPTVRQIAGHYLDRAKKQLSRSEY